jgi:hypothetical protein
MAKVNPIELQKHLKGLDYPASRDAIVSQAESNGADDETLDILRKIKDGEYEKPTDISHAVSEA